MTIARHEEEWPVFLPANGSPEKQVAKLRSTRASPTITETEVTSTNLDV